MPLSIVATPIGNLQDITLRALTALGTADAIACEDTRVTSKLLAAHKISKPLIAFHEHTDSHKLGQIVERLRNGERIAYVSDAGTPGMNDPGGKLVSAALDAGIVVEPIPGPSALTAAISACGFPMDEFRYLGFVPHKKGRQTFFEELSSDPRPSVFLESTHRIEKTLDALTETLGGYRLVWIGRELTKMHETLYRGTASEIRKRIKETSTKGEFIVVVGPKKKR